AVSSSRATSRTSKRRPTRCKLPGPRRRSRSTHRRRPSSPSRTARRPRPTTRWSRRRTNRASMNERLPGEEEQRVEVVDELEAVRKERDEYLDALQRLKA